jgi:hypothetical protein
MNEPGTKIETEQIWRRVGEAFPFSSPDNNLVYRLGMAGILLLLALGVVAWSLRNKQHRHWIDLFVAAVRGLLFFVPAVLVALGRTIDNEILWWTFTILMLLLGIALTVVMYIKDAATVGLWAILLAPLRMVVYATLAWAFMLPSWQTWEETEKRSRVLIVLDVSPSITQTSDDIARGTGAKSKTRLDKVLDFLTDENIAFLQKIKDKNPLFVYRLGTRIDEENKEFAKGSPNWTKEEWNAWTRYDFRPLILAGLSNEGKELVTATEGWKPEEPGNADWASGFVKSGMPEKLSKGEKGTPNDQAVFEANAEKLKKRIDVARAIVLGTNVPDSVLGLVNREAPNMVQGIVVISDGRSNLGSESSIAELRERAKREKIPIFTVTVGEARENIAIAITDLQVPDRTQPEEPTKMTVGVQGIGLANQTVPVRLCLYLPGRDPKKDDPSYEIVKDVKFAPGDPPIGEIEFTLDADELSKDDLGRNLVEDSKKVGRSKQLKPGAWQIVAKVARDKREVYAEADHLSPTRTMQVLDKPIRVLLFASGPSREYQTLRTLLVREMDQKRAEVSIYLQTEGGVAGEIVQDVPPERMLTRFPDRLDTNKIVADAAESNKSEKYYNLDEYDLIIAFDPEWNEKDKAGAFRIPDTAIKNVETWVTNLGGGIMYVAGPVHTFQLARADETNRLRPLLNILPVVPEDLVLIKGKGIPREPRRLLLKPSPESADMLKLEDGPLETGGWEKFFTGKDEYKKSEVPGEDAHPRRGFFSYYPVKMVKPGATTWAEFWDFDDKSNRILKPFLVTSQPGAGRTGFLASGETYRMRAENLGYFDRFWLNVGRFLSAKREAKASRGRVLMNKEFVAGAPIKVQTRLLSPSGEPYPEGAKTPKFEVSQYNLNGELIKKIGIYEMKARKSGKNFEGYYQGQLTADPKNFPTGDFRYKVTVDVPDSPGDVLDAEFMIRKSDPELDNTRPDFASMTEMAGTLSEVLANIADPATVTKLKGSNTDPAKAKLSYKLGETDKLELIPQCFAEKYSRPRNLSGLKDIWDTEKEPPAKWKTWLRTYTVNFGSFQTLPWWAVIALPLIIVSLGLMIIGRGSQLLRILGLFVGIAAAAVAYGAYSVPVGIVVAIVAVLLSIEWLSRKLLRLA